QILLAAATVKDCDAVAALVRESRLRRSPCSFLVLQAGPSVQKELDKLSANATVRLPWPEAAASLPDLLQEPSVEDQADDESPAEGFASRVASLTPSLLPEVERLAV